MVKDGRDLCILELLSAASSSDFFHFGANAYNSRVNTHTMHIMSIIHNSIATYVFPKTYTLSGFEPGSSVPEADAVSTAPHHQGSSVTYSSNKPALIYFDIAEENNFANFSKKQTILQLQKHFYKSLEKSKQFYSYKHIFTKFCKKASEK
jgi:hypothetical protein